MPSDISAAISTLRTEQPDRDLLFVSAVVSSELHRELSQLIAAGKKHERCILFLCTYGGDSNAGFRIGRCLQHHYQHIRLVIPGQCKSAGTLIAIAANELAMGDLGELGPLDMQVLKPTELQERGSVLDIAQALETIGANTCDLFLETLISIRRTARISTKLAGKFAAQIAVGAAIPLYRQVDPVRLGELHRAMQIANEYGQRLDHKSRTMRKGALSRLIAEYPSHSFVIDRKEAGELFNHVDGLSAMEALVCCLLQDKLASPCGCVGFMDELGKLGD